MKKSEWNDEQLEQLLMQMPTVKDTRDSREIYQNISLKAYKKKKKVWMMPALATAAAALLLFILAPSFLNNMNMSGSENAKSSMDQASLAKNTSEDKDAAEIESFGIVEDQEGKNEAKIAIYDEQQSYVVNSIEKDEVLLTYGVYVGGLMFPTTVSIVVKSDGDDVVEQFQKNIPLVNDVILRNPSWGVDDIPSQYFSDFTEIVRQDGSKVVRADIAENVNPGSFASGQMSEFYQLLTSFRYLLVDYQHVELYKDGKHGVPSADWVIDKNIDLEKDTKKAYLYYMHEESGYKVLTPTYDDYATIGEAIEAMKHPLLQGDFRLHPTITKSADIANIKEDGTDLEIYFSDEAGLDDNDTFIRMVDAILLTAKEFNFKTVTFIGNIEKIGDVPFGEPVPVPLAANPLRID